MRISRTVKRNMTVAVIVILMVVGALSAGYFLTKKLIIKNYSSKLNELNTKIDGATHNVFVAAQDIRMGEVITPEKLRVETQLLTQTAGLFTDENIGMRALVNIPRDTVLYAAYGSGRNDEGSSRLVEYTCIYLSALLCKGDYVDVRIRYQNGEDFLLLSKKQVEEISISAKSCYFAVDGAELQRMASAIVDANEYDAAIYCVKYTVPTVQEPAEVTYPARAETLAVLFSEDGDGYGFWIKERGELEGRLLAYGELVSRQPVDISNFTTERGKEQSNTNNTGVVSAMPDAGEEQEDD